MTPVGHAVVVSCCSLILLRFCFRQSRRYRPVWWQQSVHWTISFGYFGRASSIPCSWLRLTVRNIRFLGSKRSLWRWEHQKSRRLPLRNFNIAGNEETSDVLFDGKRPTTQKRVSISANDDRSLPTYPCQAYSLEASLS